MNKIKEKKKNHSKIQIQENQNSLFFRGKKLLLLFVILSILILIYTYYIRILCDDELYNYGFANNILHGLVPYKDFNMIIPPLFHYLLAIFLKAFGQKLLIYHFVLSLMISGITILAYRKVGKGAFVVPLTLLNYPYTGYNIFCVLLLFLLITKEDNKYSKILDPIIIVMMILSKQTLALLAIPNILYSENKKKTLLIYLISGLLFLIYLLTNNNLLEFIDYCFLGMLDFTNKNGTGINPFLFLEIAIIIALIYLYRKEKDKNILYVLLFQIMAFPILNYYHFVISFAPALYILITKIKYSNLAVHFALTVVISFFLFFNIGIFATGENYKYISHYPVENTMKGRVMFVLTSNYMSSIKDYLDKYSDYTPYFLGYFAYQIKLNYDMPITKFDLINNGNMGYNGAKKYIEEIDEHCQKNKCIFFINEMESKENCNTQTNKEILKYAMENYNRIYSSTIFGVYIN